MEQRKAAFHSPPSAPTTPACSAIILIPHVDAVQLAAEILQRVLILLAVPPRRLLLVPPFSFILTNTTSSYSSIPSCSSSTRRLQQRLPVPLLHTGCRSLHSLHTTFINNSDNAPKDGESEERERKRERKSAIMGRERREEAKEGGT
ncbi:hypothetical protein E2C01_056516 [Portunus trituberculatus]|uniref:Uncharacterized protein n=1 Tax=Portunus trituberculatus TaxID=210409 RepID=A0A5B7GQJ2_PORTR|nr:hypothetical protein [Portunus trituberculatus]